MNKEPIKPFALPQRGTAPHFVPAFPFVRPSLRSGFLKCLGGFLLLGLAQAALAAQPAEKISFSRQIQPILSENCYHCHGPDSSTRKPKKHPLRLDRAQYAFDPRDEGKPVILKGNPSASDLIKRIKATDEEDLMPPPSSHKSLKPAEIALIEKWISQGADYEEHWAFVPPTAPKVDKGAAGWGRNPVDTFVSAKLKENKLKPNGEEDSARLFRRLCLDLTGLPPTPEELQAFLQDKSQGAYEKAVDKFLASDACAEQFARHWLDAVRYADTQGIHHDHSRSIWPYRDWVIGAFKANMPFDQFTLAQVAGDLFPESREEHKIASGYNRLLPTTGEGGAIEEEYRAIYAKDRVDTTSAVWLGLTSGCASCHDHKFDPISTRDFYSLTAFFRNNTMPALDSSVSGNTPPILFIPKESDRARWGVVEKSLTDTNKAIEERQKQAKPEFEKWMATASSLTNTDPASASPVWHLPLADTNLVTRGSAGTQTLEWAGNKEQRPGPFGPAPRLGEGEVVSGEAPEVAREGRVSYGAFLLVEEKPQGAVFARMNKAEKYRGWDLFLSDGKPTVHIIDQFPDAALKITAREALKPGLWHHVMVVFDGSVKGADALTLYVDGRKAAVEVNNNTLGSNIKVSSPLRLGARADNDTTADVIKNGKVFVQDLSVYNRALSSVEVVRLAARGALREYLALAADQRKGEKTDALFKLYLTGFDEPNQKLQAELASLKTEEGGIRKRGATTLVMEEKKDSEPMANVLIRGNYASKGPQVAAVTPEFLPAMTADLPRNRLGLARWMMARNNPLTARVTANRVWAQFFGTGIVETTEDFGVMGSRPTNQPLLDWLAVDFRDSGWDYRHLVKSIVTSATYRQSPKLSKEKLEKDPLNKLLSRGPHLRLDAEEIRDQALAGAGLLVRTVGGPPVRPYQPEGVWEAVAMKDSNTRVYEQGKGEELYRRSFYTFLKRVAPPPAMEILNAPSREVFCTRRERSNTPLQAFVLMNDPQFVEASRQLATRALTASTDTQQRIQTISLALLGREMTSKEQGVIRKLQQSALLTYQKDPAAAEALLKVGESKADTKLAAPELAAWTLVASQMMNLDESLTK